MKPGFYKAIVKDNVDKMGMGRVKVFIPDFGGDPTDESTWYTASYMSPYAGQTNPYLNEKGGKEENQSQDSYGIWANSYHPENEVIISFVDGDEAQPVIMGAMFGQNMTDTIAGYPSNRSTNGTIGGVHPPSVEYNKRDDEINTRNPKRPMREKLTEQLWKQGLFKDFKRGQTDTGPNRDPVPQFQSFKTPRGNVFAIDDGKLLHDNGGGIGGRTYTPSSSASPYMRMRTSGGTQYMMNSDCGFVYMNSGDGASWVQISNIGVQMYTKGDLNTRAMGGYNQKSDDTYNVEVMGNMNIRSVGPINTEGETGMDIKSGGDFNIYSAGFHSVKTPVGIVSQTDANFNEQAAFAIFEFAPLILDQVKPGFAAPEALTLLTNAQQNRIANGDPSPIAGMPNSTFQGLSGTGGFNGATSQATGPTSKSPENSTLPAGDFVTHEPWANQPNSCGKPETPAEEGPAHPTEGQPLADGSTEEVGVEDGTRDYTEGDGGVVGDMSRATLTSELGDGRGHKGLDIAYEPGGAIAGADAKTIDGGKVTYAGWQNGYGNVVYIDHGNGLETRYAHLSSIGVQEGDTVGPGTTVGAVGNTGGSRGAHLHYETRVHGKVVDPRTIYPQLNGIPVR